LFVPSRDDAAHPDLTGRRAAPSPLPQPAFGFDISGVFPFTGAMATASPVLRKLLVLDTSFTFEMIRERGLLDSVTCRDLGGFFDHVWTVHPFASMLTSDGWTSRYGRPVRHRVNSRHTFIEGKVGRFRALGRLFPINFLLSQAGIFLMLLRLIRREKIDVVRVGSPLYVGLFGWALSRLSGIPLVIRVGGNHDKMYETTGRPAEPRLMRSRRIEKAVERFVFPRADLVAGANQDNLEFALANGARPERSTLFRYGNLIDKRHFAEPADRGLEPALLEEIGVTPKGFLIYVGRLVAVKHPDDVLRVLAEMRGDGHEIKAVLVGDGPMRPQLVELARELGVEGQVILAGNKPQGWLAQVFPQAAVVISPHTGRALSEAALAGVPIVAYDLDWQGELVETGVTGELVPHRDWREMASAVQRFLTDPEHAGRMGRAVRRRALEMLDPAALDQHERDQYSRLIAQHRRRRD
jgi:glycosyltransferase involved in cell wall biosynthesis